MKTRKKHSKAFWAAVVAKRKATIARNLNGSTPVPQNSGDLLAKLERMIAAHRDHLSRMEETLEFLKTI